jgi:hypothetical protein
MEFGKLQAVQRTKPVTAEIRRRVRDQKDRERRLIRAMQEFSEMGGLWVIDRGTVH